MGRSVGPMAILTEKRLSGKAEIGRERVEFGAFGRDGLRVETFNWDEWPGFGRTSSGSAAGGRAAEVIVAMVSMASKTSFIVISTKSFQHINRFPRWSAAEQQAIKADIHSLYNLKQNQPSLGSGSRVVD